MQQKHIYTITDFENDFPDNDTLLKWLKKFQYPDGIFCPTCNKPTNHYRIAKRRCYKCQNCGHEIYPFANTIFYKSHTILYSWLYALFFIASLRKDNPAQQLQRELGITYKTAWRISNKIKRLFNS